MQQISKTDLNQFNDKIDQIFIYKITVVFKLHIFETDKHENTFFDEAILLCSTRQIRQLFTVKSMKKNIVEFCLQKRQNNRMRVKLIINITLYRALPKQVPIG